MGDCRRGKRSVEKRLRRERPKPSDDLVRRITGQIGGERPRRHWNLGLAFALTLALLTAFALTGGVRYAASTITSGTQAVAHLVSAASPTTSPSSRTSSVTLSTREHGNGGDDGDDDDSGDDEYGHKVLMCHKPNSRHPQTIRVRQRAVAAHLAHGDTLGPC